MIKLSSMEQKLELTTKDGRTIRAVPHMLEDLSRFGVSQKKPALRNVPKELLDIPQKTIIPKELKTEAPPLPEMQSSVPETKVTKPVRKKK